jgi:heme-degrading monooxygenase HmoA
VSIVEISTFRLAQGVTDESFLALDRRVQTELVPNQPGFMRRTTARHGDDWLVVTLWSTDDAAAAFQRAVGGHPHQVAFEHALQAGTFHLARYTTLD